MSKGGIQALQPDAVILPPFYPEKLKCCSLGCFWTVFPYRIGMDPCCQFGRFHSYPSNEKVHSFFKLVWNSAVLLSSCWKIRIVKWSKSRSLLILMVVAEFPSEFYPVSATKKKILVHLISLVSSASNFSGCSFLYFISFWLWVCVSYLWHCLCSQTSAHLCV